MAAGVGDEAGGAEEEEEGEAGGGFKTGGAVTTEAQLRCIISIALRSRGNGIWHMRNLDRATGTK